MKIRHLIALCGILLSGPSSSIAQSSTFLVPFDVSVTNLDWDHFPTFLTSQFQANQATVGGSLLVVFFDGDFTTRAKWEIDELFSGGGVTKHRLVRILDGGHVVTEGRLAGRSGGLKSDGLVLAFASDEGAKQAAAAIRKSVAEGHMDELIQRRNPNL